MALERQVQAKVRSDKVANSINWGVHHLRDPGRNPFHSVSLLACRKKRSSRGNQSPRMDWKCPRREVSSRLSLRGCATRWRHLVQGKVKVIMAMAIRMFSTPKRQFLIVTSCLWLSRSWTNFGLALSLRLMKPVVVNLRWWRILTSKFQKLIQSKKQRKRKILVGLKSCL